MTRVDKLPRVEELVFVSVRRNLTQSFSKDQVVSYFLVDLFNLPLFVLGVRKLCAAFRTVLQVVSHSPRLQTNLLYHQ